jgi:hypothetical protein
MKKKRIFDISSNDQTKGKEKEKERTGTYMMDGRRPRYNTDDKHIQSQTDSMTEMVRIRKEERKDSLNRGRHMMQCSADPWYGMDVRIEERKKD